MNAPSSLDLRILDFKSFTSSRRVPPAGWTQRLVSWGALSMALLLTASVSRADFQGATHLMPFDEETIQYGKTKDTGQIAHLQARIDKGEVKLQHDEHYGYLLAVLQALGIQTNSQLLVFSKTSFQRERIGPRTPRALFYNDDTYIGFVLGSPLLEISTADPKLGGVFYTLSQNKADRPKFVRNDQCLECHASGKTMGVPGHLVRSFETDESGVVDLITGASMVNHRTSLEERWGGWYVSGAHGNQTHRGNLIGKGAFDRQQKEPNYLGNRSDLREFFNVSEYPVPTSDIVSLMVHEHQTHMHNFLTRLNYEATIALQQYGHINYLKNVVEAFLKYLLFTEETGFTSPIHGSPEFARQFVAMGPADKRGRSLRDFDLQKRLFKYPCSYLIYSDAFDALPEKLKAKIYRRLWDILTDEDQGADFRTLSADSKRAIREILIDTKPNLPAYWKRGSK